MESPPHTPQSENASEAAAAEPEPLVVPAGLLRSLRADPHNAAERLVLFAADRLGEPSWRFAERERQRRPEASPAELSAPVVSDAVRLARIDGAVAGTPFFLALVPAYLAVLWEQVSMAMRIAALHGRDPRERRFAAELLWLRGVHPTVEEAEAAVERVRGTAIPRTDERGWLRRWYALGRRVLVLAGFLSPRDPDAGPTPRWRMLLGFAFAGALWAVTWVLPLTFMAAMAFSCVSSTNALADSSLVYYGTAEGRLGARKPDPGAGVSRRTRVLRWAVLALTVGLPLAALGLAVKQRQTGVNWYSALGVLVGLAIVLALAAARARRERQTGVE